MAQAQAQATAPAATTNSIKFELVSPEEKLVSEPVWHAVIPGEDGELGIGPDHTALVVALKPGVVRLYRQKDAEPWKIFITGGFADVTGKTCTVLAEDAYNVSGFNQAELEQDLKNAQEDLARATDAVDKARATRRINMTKAKIQAITGQIVF
jgi:F-type H+-transporting ATPase subunit epsilon